MKAKYLCIVFAIGMAGWAHGDKPLTLDNGLSGADVDERAAALMTLADRSTAQLRRGIAAADRAIEIVAANMSLAQTTAYKRRDAFPGAEGVVRIGINMEQGDLQSTGRPVDVAIQGAGFFKVKVLDTIGNGIAYTRNGSFFINSTGELVVGMGDGYRLNPPVTLPKGITEDQIQISEQGEIFAAQPRSNNKVKVGQLQLTQFTSPQALQLLGGSLYQETDLSGPPIAGQPGQNATGKTLENYLEKSNVDILQEKQRMRKLREWRIAMLDALETRVGPTLR